MVDAPRTPNQIRDGWRTEDGTVRVVSPCPAELSAHDRGIPAVMGANPWISSGGSQALGLVRRQGAGGAGSTGVPGWQRSWGGRCRVEGQPANWSRVPIPKEDEYNT